MLSKKRRLRKQSRQLDAAFTRFVKNLISKRVKHLQEPLSKAA